MTLESLNNSSIIHENQLLQKVLSVLFYNAIDCFHTVPLSYENETHLFQ